MKTEGKNLLQITEKRNELILNSFFYLDLMDKEIKLKLGDAQTLVDLRKMPFLRLLWEFREMVKVLEKLTEPKLGKSPQVMIPIGNVNIYKGAIADADQRKNLHRIAKATLIEITGRQAR